MRIATHCPCCAGTDLQRSPAVLMPLVANRAFGWTPVEITPDWGFRDLKTGMAYSLCNSMQCQACGFLFLDIRFDDEEMDRLYSNFRSEDYARQRDAFEPGYAAMNAAIQVHVPDTSDAERALAGHVTSAPRVLDWGGNGGKNTPFRQIASQVDIYDLSDEPPIAGVRRVNREQASANRYDLVVACHVLEHVPYPETVVRPAAAMLDEDGVLYVEVPHEILIAGSPGARDLAPKKRHWHEHINFFTEDAMRALLERCGLEVVGVDERPFDSLVPTMTRVISMVCRKRKAS
jgi:SAM-dependent methyltransferase